MPSLHGQTGSGKANVQAVAPVGQCRLQRLRVVAAVHQQAKLLTQCRPCCWPTQGHGTYKNTEDAIEAAKDRQKHLESVAAEKKCPAIS